MGFDSAFRAALVLWPIGPLTHRWYPANHTFYSAATLARGQLESEPSCQVSLAIYPCQLLPSGPLATTTPYVFRGNGGALSDQARFLVANLIWHIRHNDQLQVAASAAVCAARSASGDTDGDGAVRRCRDTAIPGHVAVAHLLGITEQLAYRVATKMDAMGWKWTRVRHGKRKRWRPKAQSDSESASGGLADIGSSGQAVADGCDGCNIGYLPKLANPIDDDLLDSDESGKEMNALAIGSNLPRRSSQVERWKEHPKYIPAMTHAELSTFWITAGLPAYRWPDFLAWFRTQVGSGASANINCSHHWLAEFSTSLCKTILSRTAASIHALIPALGIPSDLVRVIDVISVGSVSTLPIIAVHTSHDGEINMFSVWLPNTWKFTCSHQQNNQSVGIWEQGQPAGIWQRHKHTKRQLHDACVTQTVRIGAHVW